MLESRPTRQQVVGDAQDVIRLVVRQVNLEQAEAIVDRPIKPQPFHQQVDRADPARGNRTNSLRDLVVDRCCGKLGSLRGRAIHPRQPPGDSSLAVFQLPSYFGVHSKLLRERRAA